MLIRLDRIRRMPLIASVHGLYLRNLSANLFGVATVGLLNLFTPLDTFKTVKTFFFSEGGWVLLAAFYPSAIALIILLQALIQRPLLESLSQGSQAAGEEALLVRARRRVLNLPFFIAFLDLVIWVVIPVAIMSYFLFFRKVPVSTALFVYFRTVVIGAIAASISFFLVEEYSRKNLIPKFFPEGRLTSETGTLRIPVRRRIRVLYTAGTLVPMMILVGTISFTLWDVNWAAVSALEFGRDMLVFSSILCALFVLVAFRLNSLVARSIADPLDEMVRAVREAGKGDFIHRMEVVSNDEIGILAEAGNEMLKGLAERERIRDLFGRYMTPEIRDQILDGRIPLHGQRVMATVMFADLRGFTSYVEDNPPEEVISSMRTYFTAMHRVIRHHQGTVLQFVGDEIEAAFGMPVRDPRHAEKAVEAALDMRRALAELNADRIKKGRIAFSHGIGIHTGEVLAGNTGSEEQPSYALIGDTVNLAKRIQELTKDFRCDILVSEQTFNALRRPFQVEKNPEVIVRGFSKRLTLYRVVS